MSVKFSEVLTFKKTLNLPSICPSLLFFYRKTPASLLVVLVFTTLLPEGVQKNVSKQLATSSERGPRQDCLK